ncbi:MAG TPA: WD40 repeat domain-containing protein [Candidatus Kapabacteria bacterium]|nr:WD40 repeat domain-containing protein [Candidatus Kapabacteria bacterium]
MNTEDEYKRYYRIDQQHPYAGLHSFQETDSEYFFGRKQETADLVNLIEDNVLTVIFGKSGVGKTSLLRAGLFPHFIQNYFLPIYLRIDFSNEEKCPMILTKETILAKIKEMDPDATSIDDMTLWEYFSVVKIQRGIVKPLLFFDQFEELFTTGKNNPQNVNEFITELADLIENRVPSKAREKWKNDKREMSRLDSERNLRVIISLREDYLPQLETLYSYIPSLRFSRYRVSQMKGLDAIDAVLKPGKEIIKDPAVAEEIIKKIPGSKDADYSPYDDKTGSWKNKKIEPFLLSLFCYQVNEKRLEKKADVISREIIADVNAEGIIKDYYEKNISRFRPEVKNAIEDLLVTEEGYRKLHDLHSLETGYNVTDKDIEGLINRRIIRKEIRCDIEYVELIHDVLAPILKESKTKRIKEEKRKKEEAIKRKRTRRIYTVVTVLIIVIVSALIVFILDQNAEIKKEKQRAEEEGRRAKEEERKGLAYETAAYSIDALPKDHDLSFRLAKRAVETDKNNLVAYRALLSVFYDGGIHNGIIDNKGSEFSKTRSEKADFFAAFSPDGNRILTTVSNKAELWNKDGNRYEKSRELTSPEGLQLNPNAVFSADGNYIVMCTNSDTTVILWDLAKNQMTPLVLEGGVNTVAFSPIIDQKIIAAACRDKKVRLFDLTGKTAATFTGHTGVVNSVAFSRDGQYIVSAGWDAVRLWDLNGNQVKDPFKSDIGGFSFAAFSIDGQFIVIASTDGSLHLWDLKNNKSRILGIHKEAATFAVFSPNGQYILTGSEDRTVRLVTRNNFLVFEFNGFTDIIHTSAFSPDGKYILIAPARGPAQLRLIDPQEIIHLVDSRGNIRPLTEAEKETYNLRNL